MTGPTHTISSSRSHRRRGTVYIAVLAVSALVLVLGVGGVAASRAMARASVHSQDLGAARWCAASGIEVARSIIQQNPLWRSQRSNGAWLSDVPMGDATMSVKVNNPNGALNRSPYDPVDVTAEVWINDTYHSSTLTLEATSTAYTCLDNSLTAAGAISISSGNVFGEGQTIAGGLTVTALLSNVYPNVAAVGLVAGVTFYGQNRILAGAATLPGTDAFNYYISNGTSIPIGSIGLSGSNRLLTRVVLSPASNPISSTTNPQGIYVIDCNNAVLLINNCRIVGTLVILNPGAGTTIQSSNLFEPAVINYPCVMVRGDLAIRTVATTLQEATGTVYNFNPTGTPYPWPSGVADADTTDAFPSVIDGLVYVSGTLTTSGNVNTDVLVVGGGVNTTGSLYLNYDSVFKRSPPPGFASVTMTPKRGSLRQNLQ